MIFLTATEAFALIIYHYLIYLTVSYSLTALKSSSYRKFSSAQAVLMKIDVESIGPPPKFQVKDALSGLKQYLATDHPLKVMNNTFYFTLKALFVLKACNFLS